MPLRMRVHDREPIGLALRRFKKLLERSGIQKELRKLKEQKLGKLQLSQAKNQLIGQLVIANETRSGLLVHIGKGILKFGRARTMKETIQSIEKITAESLQDTANEVFDIQNFSHLHYIPDK